MTPEEATELGYWIGLVTAFFLLGLAVFVTVVKMVREIRSESWHLVNCRDRDCVFCRGESVDG